MNDNWHLLTNHKFSDQEQSNKEKEHIQIEMGIEIFFSHLYTLFFFFFWLSELNNQYIAISQHCKVCKQPSCQVHIQQHSHYAYRALQLIEQCFYCKSCIGFMSTWVHCPEFGPQADQRQATRAKHTDKNTESGKTLGSKVPFLRRNGSVEQLQLLLDLVTWQE